VRKVKQLRIWIIVAALVLSPGMSSANAIETKPRAGVLDCMKATGYSKKGVLVNAYRKNPEQKTSTEWFNAYMFARLFTGYPNCFNKNDVTVMRKYVSTINNVCLSNPKWSTVCAIANGYGPIAWWAYQNA